MTPDPTLVEKIVAAVERRLRDDLPGSAESSEMVGASAVGATGGDTGEVVCVERVVTGELLAESLTSESHHLRIGADSILTPSARELIAQHELTVTADAECGESSKASGRQRATGWRLLLSGSDVSDLRGVVSERSDGLEAAVQTAVEWLSSVEGAGVVVLCSDPHRFACLANRRCEVRAVVVRDAEESARVLNRLGANLVVACPLASGAWQSRQIVETCLAADPPQAPADWPSHQAAAGTGTETGS